MMRDRSAAAEALVRLARRAGLRGGDRTRLVEQVLEALDADRDEDLPAANRLSRAARSIGLQATPVELLDHDALAYVGPGRPALALDATGSGWVGFLREEGGALHWIDRHGQLRREITREVERALGCVLPQRRWLLLGAAGEEAREGPPSGRPQEPTHPRSAPTSDTTPSTPLTPPAPTTKTSMPPAAKPTPLRRLIGLLRPDASDLLGVVLFAVVSGTLMLATPIAVQALVNFVAMGGALPPLVVVAGLLFLVLVLAGLLTALQTWVVEILQRRLFVRLVADLGARLPRLDPAVHEARFGPELVNRFFDVVTIQKVGAGLLLDGLSVLLSVLVGLVVLAFYHPLLLAYDVLLLGLIFAILLAPLRRGTRTAIAESKAKHAVAAWFDELVRQPLLFRSPGLEPWVLGRTDEVARAYVEQRRAHFRVLFGQLIGGVALHAIASTVLLGIGGLLVIRGSLTLGQLVAAELIVTMIVGSVAKLGKHIEGYYDLMAATDKVGELLDLPVEASGQTTDLAQAGTGPCRLELRGVTGGRAGRAPSLEALSLEVTPGQRLGVRGPCGVGKRYLLELLWGVRRPEQGTVLHDGRSLRDLTPAEVRTSAALIADPEVLASSVLENVRLGRAEVSEDEVRSALRRVGLLTVVEDLPEGLRTPLSHQGWPLSAGEVRCLQVARVLVQPPRLLLVSDDLLELSGELRRCVVEALTEPEAPWTLVVGTNAPDLLERCDRILELPSGAVHGGPRRSA